MYRRDGGSRTLASIEWSEKTKARRLRRLGGLLWLISVVERVAVRGERAGRLRAESLQASGQEPLLIQPAHQSGVPNKPVALLLI